MNVDSSQIQSINYIPKGGILVVNFHYKGRVYVYANVPPGVWEQFQKAKSKGKFLHEWIKPNFHMIKVA